MTKPLKKTEVSTEPKITPVPELKKGDRIYLEKGTPYICGGVRFVAMFSGHYVVN